MSDEKLTEEEIHAHPEFQAIEAIVQQLATAFDGTRAETGLTVEEGIARVEQITDAVIDNEILTHMSVHEAIRLSQGMVPQQLLGLLLLPFTRMWYQAFIVGAKYQAMKDADLVSLPDDFSVSDFLGELPDSSPELKDLADLPRVIERDIPAIEDVQAVQELPSTAKRNLFKDILGKKDKDTPTS